MNCLHRYAQSGFALFAMAGLAPAHAQEVLGDAPRVAHAAAATAIERGVARVSNGANTAGEAPADAPNSVRTTPCGVDSALRDDGVVELSNTTNVEKCAPVASQGAAPAASVTSSTRPGATSVVVPTDALRSAGNSGVDSPAPAEPGPAANAGTGGDGSASQGGDARAQQYRDRMLAAPSTAVAGSNPAVSRRYKMVTKEAYQAALQSDPNASQSSAAPAADPTAPTQ